MTDTSAVHAKWLGTCAYAPILTRMRDFTVARSAACEDELWALEHEPVYTLGQAGKPEHILDAGNIAVVRSDRGGQVTYHGPGQLVIYTLLDLRCRDIGLRQLVNGLEQSVKRLLASFGVSAELHDGAPGVYVDGAKVSSLGLRVKRGCAYHGVALNVAMDLAPFQYINPCGYVGLPVVDMRSLGIESTPIELALPLCNEIAAQFDLELNRMSGAEDFA